MAAKALSASSNEDQVSISKTVTSPLLAELVGQLEAAKRQEDFKSTSIHRTEDKTISIPRGMSVSDALTLLKRYEQEQETTVDVHYQIPCYPLDGARAIKLALQKLYGIYELKTFVSMFGSSKPTMVNLRTSLTSSEEIPWGAMSPPGITGYIELSVDSYDNRPMLIITGTVKRKEVPVIKEIIDTATSILSTQSIYKGSALRVDLSQNPIKSPPEFMTVDVSREEVIWTERVTQDIESRILLRIERTDLCRRMGMPLKYTTLLSGEFGTGKTLTAKLIAKIASDNGWTFFYIKSPEQLAKALQMAKIYQPAVVFVEDCDTSISGDRNNEMNEILNTMDGIDTKDIDVITVLTTNHPELLNPAAMRAGRIDSLITLDLPDAVTAFKFVKLYAKEYLAEDVDSDTVGKAFSGFSPAFINEGVKSAILRALYVHNTVDVSGKLTTDLLCDSALSLATHASMARLKPTLDTHPLQDALEKMSKALADGFTDHLSNGSGEDVKRILKQAMREYGV